MRIFINSLNPSLPALPTSTIEPVEVIVFPALQRLAAGKYPSRDVEPALYVRPKPVLIGDRNY
ncbi:MAG: hypothetical protein KME19_12620 [Microcoleus vaginatus WJT46-NPBG5]|nr:hypothetical protein [Microcoleus vaginatus WJT46-NPBG5]